MKLLCMVVMQLCVLPKQLTTMEDRAVKRILVSSVRATTTFMAKSHVMDCLWKYRLDHMLSQVLWQHLSLH